MFKRIALAQIETRLGDVKGNTRKVSDAIERAKSEKIDLLVTPEMALLGFGAGDVYLDKVEENEGALRSLVKKVRGFTAVIGYVARDSSGFLYNSAAIVFRGRIAGIVHKTQLVNYRLFDEKRYFQPGKTFTPIATPAGNLGVLICEDMWFPEPARILTLRNAHFLVCLSASPYDRGKDEIWEHYLRVRAMDNIIPVLFCNSTGCHDGVSYWGGSMVINAHGNIISRGKFLEEDWVVAQLPSQDAQIVRSRDIRIRELRKDVLEELLQAFDERK